MAAKTVSMKLVADTADAQKKLDDIMAKAEELGRLNPEIKPKLDKAAVTAGLAVLRQEIKDATKDSDDLGVSLENVGKSASSSAPGLTAMGGPMAAILGSAVALAPIAVTVGAGLGGIGIAAAGILSPILKASQATGGLAANMKDLDPAQQSVAKSLQLLGDNFHEFQAQLAPVVLKDFGSALGIAQNGMKDLLPVSQATGKALGGVLDRLDAEFQSGTWQSFFTWMGAQAGPDMKLIGDSVINLTDALPSLLQNLQPASVQLLAFVDDASKLVDVASKVNNAVGGMGVAAGKSSGFLSAIGHAALNAVDPITTVGSMALKLADHLDGTSKAAPDASKAIQDTGAQADTAQVHIQSMATAVTTLMNAETKSLDAQLAYSNALIASSNNAVTLSAALKDSSDKIGLHTTAQKNSFSAANQYISSLEQAAQQAINSGHGATAAADAISKGLPTLDAAKSKNRLYWQEVQTLVGWLDKLRAEKNIRLTEVVTGSGSWTMHNPSNQSLPGAFPGGVGAAAGMLVSGGTPGRDSVPILAMPGEAVVPAHLTPMVAPLLKAHGVPGFAAGGIVPGYAGNVAGMGAWTAHNTGASLAAITSGIGAAIAHQVVAAAAAAATSGFGAAGPGGGAPAANAALARSMFPGENFTAWNYVAMRESGWNQFARNPTSGAYGIAQALPPTKYPFAGQAAGGSNPAAQISWMEGYMRSRYGGAVGAAAHERAFNWYAGGTGGAAPGWAWVGERGPELAYLHGGETILSAAQSAGARGMRGYASGTTAMQTAGLSLAGFYSQGGGTIAANLSEMKLFLKDIDKYFAGSSAAWRDAEVKRQTTRLDSIVTRLDAVKATIASARSYQQSVQSGLSGYADLSSLTTGQGVSIESQLTGSLSNLKTFAGLLRKLAAAHLPASLMRQVVALGPDQGTAFAQEILGGGPALMRALTGTEAAIGSTELGISRGAASDVYTGQFKSGAGFLSSLTAQKHKLTDLFKDVGEEMGKEAARWFGDTEMLHHGSGHGKGTFNQVTINVHVPVSANKAETGRAIVEAIRDFEKRSGKSWRTP